MEIEIRILGLVIAQVGRPYFEHARSHLASILQMMASQHAHELFRPGVPVPLAGPGAGLQFEQVDADLLQPARNREAATKTVRALTSPLTVAVLPRAASTLFQMSGHDACRRDPGHGPRARRGFSC
jgi:hypothetical protein